MTGSICKFSFHKSWYRIYILTLLGCLPFILNFLWGNHDWEWIKEGTPIWSGIFEGRFSQFILPTIVFSGNILPIFSVAISLAFLTTTAILCLKIWQAPKKYICYILLSLNITLAPYTLSWFYFAFITLSCLSWTCVIALGYYLLAYAKNKLFATTLATTLFTLALGGYPPCINMMGVIFFSLILKDLCSNKFPPKSLIYKYVPYITSLLTASLLFLLIQYELKIHNLQSATYNTAGTDITNLPTKIFLCLKISLQQFINTTSFIDTFYKYTFLAISLCAILSLLHSLKKSYISNIIFILSVLGLLISSVMTTLLAKNTDYVLYEPRIEFFSLPYIYTFAAAILLTSYKQFIRNITLLSLILTLLHNINTIAYTSKIWNAGFKAETNLSERIVSRIENHQNFIPYNNFYTFIQGDTISIRQKYYQPKSNEAIDSYTVTAPYIPWHLPSKTYTFYYPNNFIYKDYDVYWRFIFPQEIPLNTATVQYIMDKAIAWPHANAIYLDNSLIILTMSKNGETFAKQWLQNQQQK